jgi:hypothetical protein
MPKRSAAPLFELGNYWIAKVPGSSRLYRFWYDAGVGEIRRRSLETSDLETAKVALAAIVLREGTGRAGEPRDVPLITVLTRYFEEHSDARPNPSAARRAGDLLLDFLGNDAAKVAELTQARQREFMAHLSHKHGHSVAYISRVQSIIAAALNRAVATDDDDAGALLTRAPRIIVQLRDVAAILNAPEPEPANWHPDIPMLARFLDAIPADEESRLLRFTILTLVFGRPEAVRELTPFQIDERHKLVALNAQGRRQTKKHRATLPMPEVLWDTLLAWRDAGTIIHIRKEPVLVLRKPWAAVRAAAGLPDQFVPKSLRHMLATELRMRRVPKEERELWQGHRRLSTNDRYGHYDPDFLSSAKAAVNDLLLELAAACQKPLFRQVSAKAAIPFHTGKVISL